MTSEEGKPFTKVTHCIFDNDGTMMDTEQLYTNAVQNILTPYGKKYSKEQKISCMGLIAPAASAFMVKDHNLPISDKEYLVKYNAEVQRLMSNVQLLPGVKDLLVHLFQQRVPMAVATSDYRQSFTRKASNFCDLMPVFRHFVCGDDPELEFGKPAPDIFLLAASRFNPAPKPECCLVFEDAPNGVLGAVAAGMQVVMIPDKFVPIENTRSASLVLRSMTEFEPELFGLPAYDNCSKFTFG